MKCVLPLLAVLLLSFVPDAARAQSYPHWFGEAEYLGWISDSPEMDAKEFDLEINRRSFGTTIRIPEKGCFGKMKLRDADDDLFAAGITWQRGTKCARISLILVKWDPDHYLREVKLYVEEDGEQIQAGYGIIRPQ